LDSLPIGFDVIRVDLVLWGGRVEGAEFEQYFYGSLVFGDGDPLGAFSLQVYGFIGVLDRE
jgi:hypothetical protein